MKHEATPRFPPRGCPLCAKLFSWKRETVDDPTVRPSSTFQRATQAHNKVFCGTVLSECFFECHFSPRGGGGVCAWFKRRSPILHSTAACINLKGLDVVGQAK